MSAELYFILTLAVLGIVSFICMKVSTREPTFNLLGSSKILTYLGTGFGIIGLALFSTYGLAGISISAPFLIVGFILGIVDNRKVMSSAFPKSQTSRLSNLDDATLNQLAEGARTRGILVEESNPTDPSDEVLQIKCPSCSYLFELGTSKIVGLTVYCPSCYKGTDLSQ